MRSLQDEIAGHHFFSDMDPRYLEVLSGCAQQELIKAGKRPFREGAPADHFYLIKRGHIALQFHSAQAGYITFETLHEGSVEGFSFIFPPYKWLFDGIAVEDTLTVRFDGRCLRSKCEEDGALGYALMKRFGEVMAERLHHARVRLVDMYR